MSQQKRLAVISPTFPYPLESGGKQRVFFILKHLAKEFHITLLTLVENPGDEIRYREKLDFVDELVCFPIRQGRLWQAFRLLRYAHMWLLGTPAEVIVKRSAAMMRECKRRAISGLIDAVQFEFVQTAQYLDAWKDADIARVLIAHDVSTVSHQRRAHVSRGIRGWFWQREARLMQCYEYDGWKRFDRLIAMSAVDRDQIGRQVSADIIDVVPNGVDARNFAEHTKRADPTIVFVGWMRHLPNADAVSWLVDSLWPLISTQHPEARLEIVGRGLSEKLQQAINRQPTASYRGYVEDIQQCVGSAWASIVPIRIGSGTRIKILESMALGTPVITTTVGIEGIEATDRREIMIADSPDQFADAVSVVLTDRRTRLNLAENGQRLVGEKYDWSVIGPLAAQTVAKAIASRCRKSPNAADSKRGHLA